ncbi:MAG TPA: zinc finger MYND domain-containing protein, partial [Planctomycetota bacterium]|nr:zinc finger MYND domain-containing protein [Planctomycetota bacterium]
GSALLPFALVRFAFITIALTITITIALAGHSLARGDEAEADGGLRVAWEGNILTVSGPKIPGGAIRTLYLEAYCRPECQKADWGEHTVIGHETELVAASEDGKRIELRCRLRDGVIVDHVITAGDDEVDFKLVARNPTDRPSQAHWAQPCMRVGGFTGRGDPKRAESYEYLEKSFVFLEGKLRRMPTRNWALRARYEPGQVWAAPGVPRADVNPRPLSRETPTHGLIGCFSADESKILAVAWEPCQELFQGVITCLHADFRIGGLEPGERKEIRGKLWIVPNDLDALLLRYDEAFPEHRTWPDRAGRVREVRSDETWALRDGKLFVSKGDEPPVHVFLKTGKLLLPYDQSTVVERTLARIDLLSSRHGYNHVSLNIYPDTFDEDADGA